MPIKSYLYFFDHFLTANWKNYSEQSLEAFSEQTCAYLLENTQLLPYSVKKNMKSLIDANWIVNMASIRGVHEYMQLITIKDTFQSILEYSLEDLVNNYHDFKGDFEEIMPDLTKFIKNTTNIRKNRILEEVAYVK